MKKENKRVGVIYKYTSPSGKHYIGQTINESQRKYAHKSGTSKTQTKFGKAIRKYGYENFQYETIFKLKSNDKVKLKIILDIMEKYLIHKFDSFNNGYNLNDGGEGNLGYKHTNETKETLKITNQKSEEDKKKISDTMKGRVCTEEHKRNMSKNNTNKRKVLQFSLEGEKLNSFNSITEAAQSLDQKSAIKTVLNKISECCVGKRGTAYKYVWEYE